jgi:hypothetical protein
LNTGKLLLHIIIIIITTTTTTTNMEVLLEELPKVVELVEKCPATGPRPVLTFSSYLRLGFPSHIFHSGYPTKILHSLYFPCLPWVLHAQLISYCDYYNY